MRAPGPDQAPDQFVLGAVGVLVFVHQQVADAPLPGFEQVRLFGEEARRQADEVVEIDGVVGVEAALVVGVKAGEIGLEVVLGLAQGLGGLDEGILPGGDAVLHRGGREGVGLAHRAQVLLDDRLGILGVEEGEAGAQPGAVVVAAQQVQAQGVEGGDAQAAGVTALEQAADPFLHLPGRLVGEGDGGDVARRQAALPHQVGDLAGDDPGLARAGAGQDQQGTA